MTKYGNRRTVVDGFAFDSAAESRRYVELKLLVLAGEIAHLELQPRYDLVVNGVKICSYRGDFWYVEGGETIVEDVKSEPTKTPVYKLKKKLMKALHGIEIREVEA